MSASANHASANNQAPHDPAQMSEWLLLVIPGLIWGASFLFIAEGLRSVEPNGLTFLRILIGWLTLGLAPQARGTIARADWGKVALLGVVWMALPLTLFPYAEQRVSSAMTGMLNGANPLFTAIVASLIARELPPRQVVIGLIVGLSGVVLVAWPGLFEGRNSMDGVVLATLGVLCYGVAVNLARPLQARNGGLPVIWRAQMVALVLTAPMGIPEVMRATWSVWPMISVILLGAGGTGIAYVLLSEAGARFGTTKASATTFLIPAVALGLGVLVRSERVALVSVVGCVVCLTGAWIIREARTRS